MSDTPADPRLPREHVYFHRDPSSESVGDVDGFGESVRSVAGELEHGEGVAASVEEKKESRSGSFALVRDLVAVVVLGVLLALVLHMFVTRVYAISGESMLPTFHDGEKVMISRLSPSIVGLERGDVVIFENPDDPQKNLIKRVIAMPGEKVEIIQGIVHIDGAPLDEEYAQVSPRMYGSRLSARVVPEGAVFVLGDNRPASKDSRHFHTTFVDIDAIKGKVFLRWWPLDQLTTFP